MHIHIYIYIYTYTYTQHTIDNTQQNRHTRQHKLSACGNQCGSIHEMYIARKIGTTNSYSV